MQENWDDLQLVLAIMKGGSVSAAAKILNVHHATILRRLDIFEKKLGVVLFERHATGYKPTALAEAIAERANGLSENISDVFRMLAGSDLRLSGTIRLATTDFLAQTIVPKALVSFSNAYPDITVEVIVSAQFASLSKRDADVALRTLPHTGIKQDLITRSISAIKYAVFAHKNLVDIYDDLVNMPWVAEEESLSQSSVALWSRQIRKRAPIVARTNIMMTKYALVSKGIGAGILPVYLAQNTSNLIQMAHNKNWELSLSYSAHRDLANLPRINALYRHLQKLGLSMNELKNA